MARRRVAENNDLRQRGRKVATNSPASIIHSSTTDKHENGERKNDNLKSKKESLNSGRGIYKNQKESLNSAREIHKNQSLEKKSKQATTCYNIFGFDLSCLKSWSNFVALLHQPCDPSSFAVMRILFGFLMMLDTIGERGFSDAQWIWGNPAYCRFPLFDFLVPLPIPWMYLIYLLTFLGAMGIMLGFLYHLSCFLFVIPYWYIFLLDKTAWNNHSYLFGVLGFMLLFCDGNSCWSLDAVIFGRCNHHIPLWNYGLFRFQIFVVYFIAGLKKLTPDWMFGYSMSDLSNHWVFIPFTFLLCKEQIDLWIIHVGGLVLDLCMGFALFFDKSRPFAFIFGGCFHLMNSQLFSIGMFPWAMTGTMFIFCPFNWPKNLLAKIKVCQFKDKGKSFHKNSSFHRRNMNALFFCSYICIQLFLPYSHFVTKGYNNWTNGLYGYSWDMMVHSWSTQHIRISYLASNSSEIGYLKPDAWTETKRWSSHADMLKQHAICIETRLSQYNLTNISLYFDVWRSLNDRFYQRMFDPRMDMVKSPWSPFVTTSWIMPLLVDLSDWRGKMEEIEKQIYNSSNYTDVTFIADFPGLKLENFVQEDYSNTSLTVLKGEIRIDLIDRNESKILKKGQRIQIPPGEFHDVLTISDEPSCYMYIYVNTTEQQLVEKFPDLNVDGDVDPRVQQMQDEWNWRNNLEKSEEPFWMQFIRFWKSRMNKLMRSFLMCGIAVKSLTNGVMFNESYEEVISSHPWVASLSY